MSSPKILIIEDGHEYLELLERFVVGFEYIQVHSGAEALESLSSTSIDLIYLDMCFDRTPRGDLLGDHEAMAARHGGDDERGWRFLERNQGLFILDALKSAGHAHIPILLSHDFSTQPARWAHLSAQHPNLRWLPDTMGPKEILSTIQSSII